MRAILIVVLDQVEVVAVCTFDSLASQSANNVQILLIFQVPSSEQVSQLLAAMTYAELLERIALQQLEVLDDEARLPMPLYEQFAEGVRITRCTSAPNASLTCPRSEFTTDTVQPNRKLFIMQTTHLSENSDTPRIRQFTA